MHKSQTSCSLCSAPSTPQALAEVGWLAPDAVARLKEEHPHWTRADGACPACVQQVLLEALVEHGEAALHEGIQAVWPLDAEAAFGAMPTPLRLHADPRFTGKGVTLALVDSGFYPHPDLVQPYNRIRAWVNVAGEPVQVHHFQRDVEPHWPGWDKQEAAQWHGLMTSVTAAGNGWLSHGLYRGLASEADVVLIQVRDEAGHITNATITRALRWLLRHGPALGVRVINLSVAGDPVEMLASNPIDEAIARLVENGMAVVAAAGNDGQRRLVPPATSPLSLTVGGLDDRNTFEHEARQLWHSNYGAASNGACKPELVAPSIWVVAPVLPESGMAQEAQRLFTRRAMNDSAVETRIAACKLVTPHYQHVEGTSFAAPIATSVLACMLEANPRLTPLRLRELLSQATHFVPGALRERQGAGALEASRAVTLALAERARSVDVRSPRLSAEGIIFRLHDPAARQVSVYGSWNEWRASVTATEQEPGVWEVYLPCLQPGQYHYKFRLDDRRWLSDPVNPLRVSDSLGGWNSVVLVD